MGNLFAGIDTGTQGVRIGIADETGKIVTIHETKWETEYPRPGWRNKTR